MAALAEEEKPNAGPWFVRNDYDKDYVLVSEDADEIEKEIQKVEQENALLRNRLAEVDKHAKETVEGRKDKIDVDHPRLDARPPQGQAEQVKTEQAVSEEQVRSEQAVATPPPAQESAPPSKIPPSSHWLPSLYIFSALPVRKNSQIMQSVAFPPFFFSDATKKPSHFKLTLLLVSALVIVDTLFHFW